MTVLHFAARAAGVTGRGAILMPNDLTGCCPGAPARSDAVKSPFSRHRASRCHDPVSYVENRDPSALESHALDPLQSGRTINATSSPAATPATSPSSTPRAAEGTGTAALAARVKKATAQVEAVEKAAAAVTQKAKTVLANTSVTEGTVKELQQSLQKQQAAVGEAQKNLAQEINDVRKGGPPATASVTEMSKLLPKVRAAQAGVVEQLNKARAALAKLGQAGGKEKEEKDSKDFQEAFPAIKDLTSVAEESVVAIVTMAEPIISNPPAEGSDDLKKALDEVEAASTDAQTKINEARKEITQKLTGAKNYAGEARKTALTEYSALQAKLTEAQRKLGPFRTFKKDFQQRVKAKQALSDLADKLSNAELEVEKASLLCRGFARQ
ncbi:Man1a1 [Symbiodinium natans]|uniref:Man1a1 protein n=1 Tax=Symbiodinium natans TaxID=878477 RepID=A0A812PG23_9DINO|nr:Man1a1 [Symbiodinium natans]